MVSELGMLVYKDLLLTPLSQEDGGHKEDTETPRPQEVSGRVLGAGRGGGAGLRGEGRRGRTQQHLPHRRGGRGDRQQRAAVGRARARRALGGREQAACGAAAAAGGGGGGNAEKV